MQNNTKSSVIAGVLGVFLGAFGGHDWYLGNTKKAITHVSLCVGGFILLMIGMILLNLASNIPVLNVLFICIVVAAYVIIVGNGIWGFIEGVIIIAQGDAGLAAKGYKVADPATATMNIAAPVAAADNAADPATPAQEAKPLEPAQLNNVITAAPATATTMPASVSANTPTNEPAAPVAPTTETVTPVTPATASTSAPVSAAANTTAAPSAAATPAPAPSSEPTTDSAPATSSTNTATSDIANAASNVAPATEAPASNIAQATPAEAPADAAKPETPASPSTPVSPFA